MDGRSDGYELPSQTTLCVLPHSILCEESGVWPDPSQGVACEVGPGITDKLGRPGAAQLRAPLLDQCLELAPVAKCIRIERIDADEAERANDVLFDLRIYSP